MIKETLIHFSARFSLQWESIEWFRMIMSNIDELMTAIVKYAMFVAVSVQAACKMMPEKPLFYFLKRNMRPCS